MRWKHNRYELLPGGLARIELTRDQWVLVDADRLETLLRYGWRAGRSQAAFYAATNITIDGKPRAIMMHRLLLGLPPGRHPVVDHINRDTLDNRVANLRAVTQAENMGIGHWPTGTHHIKHSRFRGVARSVSSHGAHTVRWRAQIYHHRRLYHRYCATEEDAARWYDEKAREFYGIYAFQNFPPPPDEQH